MKTRPSAERASVEELHDPWPPFLTLLETDPIRAFEQFNDFARRLLRAQPPRAFLRLPPDRQEEAIADTISRCWENDQSILRRYRNQGKPFSCWLFTLVTRQAQHVRRGRRRWERTYVSYDGELHDTISPEQAVDERLESESLVDIVFAALARLGEDCREVIASVADGYRPQEIAQALRLPPEAAKTISKRFRRCRDRLIRLLETEGVYVTG